MLHLIISILLPAICSGSVLVKQDFISRNLAAVPYADLWSNVTYLDLTQNIITTINPFPVLPGLVNLKLDFNQLDVFPNFSNITQLEYLGLQGNRISYIDQTFLLALTALKSVNLHSNRLTSFPNVKLPMTEWFGVGGINYSEQPPNFCWIVPDIKHLDVYGGDISLYPKDAFVGCRRLTSFSILSHKIKSLSELHMVGHTVKILDVKRNLITYVHYDDVIWFRLLIKLDLNGNPLVQIPNILMMPPTLVELYIVVDEFAPYTSFLPCDYPMIMLINSFRKAGLPLKISTHNSLNECLDSPENDAHFNSGLAINIKRQPVRDFAGNTMVKTLKPIPSDQFWYGLMIEAGTMIPGTSPLDCARACRLSATCAMFYTTKEGDCLLADTENLVPTNGTQFKIYAI